MAKSYGSIVVVVTLSLCVLAGSPVSAQEAEEGIVFGIRPSVLPLQSSYLGYRTGRWQPFIGLDFAWLSLEIDNDESSGKLLIPHFGSRYYFKANLSEGEVVPYLQGDVLLSLATVSSDDLTGGEQELLEDALKFWGFSLAFGAEYYFSDRFSIGGEYGVRYITNSVDEHSDVYDGEYEDIINDEIKGVFGVSYVAVTLNFLL